MFDFLEDIDWKKVATFAGGVLFGTAGIRILSSKDAKKVYTNTTAAALRAKDCVMDRVTTIQENAEDIYEAAKQINEDRAADIYYADYEEEDIEKEDAAEEGDAQE